MTKRNIRLLATGFLVSGLLLTAFQTVNGTASNSSESESSEEIEADLRVLEEKTVQLELENEQLRTEYDKLMDMQGTELADGQNEDDYSDDVETDTAESAEESENSSDTETEEDSSSSTEYKVVINEGEPSSVIASQLESYGLINDYFEFNDYLEDNDLIRKVRPGEFTVNSDMNRTQIIEAIIR